MYAFYLKVEKVKDTLNVQLADNWTRLGGHPRTLSLLGHPIDHLRQTYVRFFKTVSLAGALKLTANELTYLAANADYQIGGQGWLNSLPVSGNPDNPTSVALFTVSRCAARLRPPERRRLRRTMNACWRCSTIQWPPPKSPTVCCLR